MNTFVIILLAVAGFIVLVLILALIMNKQYTIQRHIVINADSKQVFDYIKQLKNQDHFNKWVMMDPEMKKEFSGTDGSPGFIYKWDGNKQAGAGEQEIKSVTEGKNVSTEIRFIRPFASVAYANLSTERISDNQTKVGWSNAGTMVFPMNIMLSMVTKMLAKDMDTSLGTLKSILEK